MIQKYMVVEAETISEFESAVNEKIREGWQPYGTLNLGTPCTSYLKFYQAMVLTSNQSRVGKIDFVYFVYTNKIKL